MFERVGRIALIASVSVTIGTGVALAESHEETIVAHGISTFGDLKYGPDFEHYEYVNPDAPKGGLFSTWAFGTFDTLNPYILRGNSAFAASAVFDTLMTSSADEPDSLYGLVAETIEYPEDRSWAAFNLRPEARFSDGSPLTSADVVFSYNALVNEGRPVYQLTFQDVASVTAEGPHRVRFDFVEGAPTRELPSLVAGIPIFSAAWWEGRDFTEPTLEPILGSGPYVVGDLEAGRFIAYERNMDYWAADLPVNKGQNNFDEVRYEYYADYTAAFEGFKAGVYTFREEFSSAVWGTGYDFPAVNDGTVVVEQLVDGTPTGTQGFFFNLRRDKFADLRVREAIAMMFNFEWSNRTLFYDLYKRTDSFWENSPLEATGMPTEAELALLEPLRADIPETVFTEEAFLPPVSRPDRVDRRLLRRASALLDEAGWTVVDGRRVNAEGEVFTIDLLNDVPAFERIINPFVQNLQQLGIDVEAPLVDNATSSQREKEFDFDMVIRRYRMSLTPGPELYGLFGSDGANTEDSANVAGLANPAVDALIDQIQRAETREELNTAVSALDRVLRAMHIWVPQWANTTHNIAYLDMYARPDIKPPYSRGTETWWLDTEKAAALEAAGKL
ncbi:MAG: extracellular solute-binding protein [Pseudomonadota bacterium]